MMTAQFVILFFILLGAFLVEWGFVNNIIRRGASTSFLATVIMNAGSIVIGGFILLFFDLVTFSTEDFVLKFSMGIKGFASLFWTMIVVWFGSFLLDYFILEGLYKTLIRPPLPPRIRMVTGLLFANFFSSPLITLCIWLFQFD